MIFHSKMELQYLTEHLFLQNEHVAVGSLAAEFDALLLGGHVLAVQIFRSHFFRLLRPDNFVLMNFEVRHARAVVVETSFSKYIFKVLHGCTKTTAKHQS